MMKIKYFYNFKEYLNRVLILTFKGLVIIHTIHTPILSKER